jgi:hypothetical protein
MHLQKDWGQLGTHLAFNFAWFSPYLVLLTGLIAWAPAKVRLPGLVWQSTW